MFAVPHSPNPIWNRFCNKKDYKGLPLSTPTHSSHNDVWVRGEEEHEKEKAGRGEREESRILFPLHTIGFPGPSCVSYKPAFFH